MFSWISHSEESQQHVLWTLGEPYGESHMEKNLGVTKQHQLISHDGIILRIGAFSRREASGEPAPLANLVQEPDPGAKPVLPFPTPDTPTAGCFAATKSG